MATPYTRSAFGYGRDQNTKTRTDDVTRTKRIRYLTLLASFGFSSSASDDATGSEGLTAQIFGSELKYFANVVLDKVGLIQSKAGHV
jgi:hypothetical protein